MSGEDPGAHREPHPHSNFQARSARDEAGELSSRWSGEGLTPRPSASREHSTPYDPATNDSTPPPREHELTRRFLHLQSNDYGSANILQRSSSGRPKANIIGQDSLTVQMHNEAESKKVNGDSSAPKPGLGPRPVGGDEKLGMFSGVYVPTCLNVLSILMFLRFGFILGLFRNR
jgi:hypothetical protein